MKTNGKYIMDGDGNIIKCNDLLLWAKWFEAAGEKRRVAYDKIGESGYISTVFLGLDYSFKKSGAPVLFETMAFPSEIQERYKTKEAALAGHKRILAQLLAEEK